MWFASKTRTDGWKTERALADSMKRVAANILTGFLGSGKTTLLRSLLEHADSSRIVAIVNELGEVGIDGRTVTGLEYSEKAIELASGCICCSVEDSRFEAAVAEIVDRCDPELVVIETTGVADPEPTIERVRRAGLGLDAVVTVVDAANAGRALAWTRVARRQIRAADFLVVSKSDLAGERAAARLERRLRRSNPRAGLVRAIAGRTDLDLLFATGVASRRLRADAGEASGSGPHLQDEGIESFSHAFGGAVDRERFEGFLGNLPSAVWRAKGFIRVAGNPWSCLFNLTCGRWELNWVRLADDGPPSQAVFIGREILPLRDSIIAGLESTRVSDAKAS
ncbi:MAG: cobalamin biosynthesis protein CobW [Candidatus Binatia bacterium]|jgi:cobalamin biosynthesis protein CobW